MQIHRRGRLGFAGLDIGFVNRDILDRFYSGGLNMNRETISDVLTAVAIAAVLCVLALSYFDVLTK